MKTILAIAAVCLFGSLAATSSASGPAQYARCRASSAEWNPCTTPIRGSCRSVVAHGSVTFRVELRYVPAVDAQPYIGGAPVAVLRTYGFVHGHPASFVPMRRVAPHTWRGKAPEGTTMVRTWVGFTNGDQLYIYDRCR